MQEISAFKQGMAGMRKNIWFYSLYYVTREAHL
jgi:hypothetical protein